MLLHSINPSLPFEIWDIDIVGPFLEREKRTWEKYIITTIEYLNVGPRIIFGRTLCWHVYRQSVLVIDGKIRVCSDGKIGTT